MLYVVKLLYAWLLPPGLFILLLLLAHILFVKTRRTRYSGNVLCAAGTVCLAECGRDCCAWGWQRWRSQRF